MIKIKKHRHYINCVFSILLLGLILFVADNQIHSRIFPSKSQITCQDRGDRIEGINCPQKISGAFIEIEAVLILPLDTEFVATDDSVYLRFFPVKGKNIIIEVKERRTNYLMRPKLSSINNGYYSWAANTVLLPLSKIVPLRYSHLLPLALFESSTRQFAYVRPIILQHTRIITPKIKGYHFIFKSNADVVLKYQFYQKVGKIYRAIGKSRRLNKPAESSFLIDWDCMIDDNIAPAGDYYLKLTGEAAVGPSHEGVIAECHFYHRLLF